MNGLTASMMATDQMQHEVTIMGGFERSGGLVYQRDGVRFMASVIRIHEGLRCSGTRDRAGPYRISPAVALR